MDFVTDHYFSPEPSSDSATRTFSVSIRGTEVDVTTDAGLFSHAGLDKGTAVLLHKAPESDLVPDALCVDLGCGWGPLTIALAEEHTDARILAVDVNARALDITRSNTASYSNVSVEDASSALARLRSSGERIDLLWSNPPIRIGKEGLHELLSSWLALLADDGVAYLVVQRNLGSDSLSAWLNSQGFESSKYGSSKGFRVLEVRRGTPEAEA